MTGPLQPPPKKNPQKRTVSPTLPPMVRSRAALGLTAAAAEGRFALQCCAECGAVQYPPRDACSTCLSTELPWRDVSPMGRLIAETRIRATTSLYFRDRLPWRTGTVQLDVGPSVICHILAATSLSNSPEMGCFSASQAAARALSQSLRGEFRAAGLRVMNTYVGPTEDDWHQPLPPPKVTPNALARDVVKGLQNGLEDVFCGDVAKDMAAKFRRDPKVLEREMTMGGEA